MLCCTCRRQIALYWQVAEKWSSVDLRDAVSTRFEQTTPNAGQAAGKVRIQRDTPYRASNPWAQRVWCMKHGRNEDGSPVLSHRMAMHASGRSWDCYRDARAGRRVGNCSMWADDNTLGRILDTHFKRGLTAALESQHAIIRSLVNDRDEQKRTAERLRAEVAELSAEKERQLSQAGAYQRSLDGMDKSFVETELDRFHRERVRPVLASLSEKQRDLRRAEAAGLASPPDTSEQEIRALLRRLVNDWDTIPVPERQFAISVFVKHVGVLVGNGFEGKEAVVEFAWTDGTVDHLVGWRGHWRDDRAWTSEEDAAVRELWPSGCDWPEIKEKLLPRRTFRRVRARARELGVAKGANRSNAWVEHHLNGDRSWNEKHPDVLYLQMHPDRAVDTWCLAVSPEGVGTVIEFPDEVRAGIAAQQEFMSPFWCVSWM